MKPNNDQLILFYCPSCGTFGFGHDHWECPGCGESDFQNLQWGKLSYEGKAQLAHMLNTRSID